MKKTAHSKSTAPAKHFDFSCWQRAGVYFLGGEQLREVLE